jgi:cyclase
MYRSRIIPCLLLQDRGLVKTTKFKKPVYVGDPINAIKIFNDKAVDELILLDIDASKRGSAPDFDLIAEVAGECFMPLCYGGGIRSLAHARQIFSLGVEKISLNSAALDRIDLISELAAVYGSQSVVASIDCKKTLLGKHRVMKPDSQTELKMDPVSWARDVERAGAGEILLNSVDRDGTMQGYDLELIASVTRAVSIPVIACGGAGTLSDLAAPIMHAGASAVAAGSLFVFHGPRRAVLINYPTHEILSKLPLENTNE